MCGLGNKFREYADFSPFAIMVYQSEKWIYANDEAAILSGYSKEELLDMKFWEFIHEDFRELVKARGKARLKGAWPIDHYDVKIIKKDGSSFWIGLYLKKFMIDDTSSIMATATVIDEKKKTQKIYKTLTDNLKDIVLLIDKDQKIEFINPIAEKIFGISNNAYQGFMIYDFFLYEHKKKLIKALEQVKKNGEYEDEFVFILRNNKFNFEVYFKTIENEEEIIIILHDITDRGKALENQKNLIKMQEIFINLITEIVKDKMDENTYNRILKMALDVVPGVQAGSVLYKNGENFNYVAAIGYDFNLLKKVVMTSDEIVKSKNPEILIVKNLPDYNTEYLDDEKHAILDAAARNEKIFEMISIPIVINEEVFAYFNLDNFEHRALINEESVKIANIFSTVVTAVVQKNLFELELKKKNEELKKKSNYDPLTSLPNRRFLSDNVDILFKKAALTGGKLYILYIDLDNFKLINDHFGHDFGDLILSKVGKRIDNTIRDTDLAARIGGDEFLLILNQIENIHLKKFLQRFTEKIQKPIKINDREFSISASIGISVFPDDGEIFEELVKNADTAMYKAKKDKINYSFYKNIKN